MPSLEEWQRFCASKRLSVDDGQPLAELPEQKLVVREPEGTVEGPETGRQRVLTHESTIGASQVPENRPEGPQADRREPSQREALVRLFPSQEGHDSRALVRIIGYRKRFLDVDAFAGACKAILDDLRGADLIEDDTPNHIRLETDQFKIGKGEAERTEVELFWP